MNCSAIIISPSPGWLPIRRNNYSSSSQSGDNGPACDSCCHVSKYQDYKITPTDLINPSSLVSFLSPFHCVGVYIGIVRIMEDINRNYYPFLSILPLGNNVCCSSAHVNNDYYCLTLHASWVFYFNISHVTQYGETWDRQGCLQWHSTKHHVASHNKFGMSYFPTSFLHEGEELIQKFSSLWIIINFIELQNVNINEKVYNNILDIAFFPWHVIKHKYKS